MGIENSKEKYFGLENVPVGKGAVLRGWNLPEDYFRNPDNLPVVDFRAMTHECRHNCFHCFTDKNKKTLPLSKIKSVIDELANYNTFAINYLGEGEPTLDKDFFEIVEYTKGKNIQPIVFTDGATKLTNRKFVRRLKESGASVCPKCDSLWNAEYQNMVVSDKNGKYFKARNKAVQILIEEGFNQPSDDGTTRLGFDMVVTKANMHEVSKTLRYCRENNIWIVFAFYLPSGRSGTEYFDKELVLTFDEKKYLCSQIKRIDEKEYGFYHQVINNFATIPCVELMQIYGDGRVSPCPGNENVVGNVEKDSIKDLKKKIIDKYPVHEQKSFDGYCPYRERLE
ncbi:MAG: radical SAM protein [Patescibacteria group bacterium]